MDELWSGDHKLWRANDTVMARLRAQHGMDFANETSLEQGQGRTSKASPEHMEADKM